LSAEHADERRAEIDFQQARTPRPSVPPSVESANTTHVTAADADGVVVTMTQTINAAFGAKVMAAGTGMLLNNTMAMFDPHPGHANSVGPGKRMVSSMAPAVITRDGQPVAALGTPGGVRIFPSVAQAIVNLIDHGMSLQEAVEAPRVWTQGQEVELESAIAQPVRDALASRGHEIVVVPNIGGGMNGIWFDPPIMTGAACWRADGAPAALSGGRARPRVDFTSVSTRS
jgi:gamma-glutamyltranspeptidase/glutathione hydrolase